MKRIVTMQDVSCIGKCSLTVALPVISAMGVETAIIPTAVLSTHTMFQGFTFHDLTNEIRPILDHWKKEGFKFDAIYTGYLGSFEQLKLAEEMFKEFNDNTKIIVDPCMADNGKLYPGFTKEFAQGMAKLCGKADIICPNMTEASFLLNIEYKEEYEEDYVRDVLQKLILLGAKTAVLTGIRNKEGKLGAVAYDSVNNVYHSYFTDEEAEHFHGTGDIWASTLTGALVNGKDFDEALKIACEFVRESIHLTLEEENHNTYGVNFEEAIPYLIKLLQA